MRIVIGLIAFLFGSGALFLSLLGVFGPSMQFGVEHRHFICSGTLADGERNPVAISGASLRLELYHFPVTLWAEEDGMAWYNDNNAVILFVDVQKIDYLLWMGEFNDEQQGRLDLISGKLQLVSFDRRYDMDCRKVSVS